MVFGSGARPGYAVGMRKDVIDAEFEVISGPSPVRWDQRRSVRPKRKVPVHEWIIAGLFGGLALFVALIGASGGDIDTRDGVQEWKDRQPVAAAIR